MEGVLRGGASPTETSTPDLSQVRGDRGRNIENLFSLCGDKGDKPDLEKVVSDGDVDADKSRRIAALDLHPFTAQLSHTRQVYHSDKS